MINNFVKWALDRDLYNNSTREKQLLKYLEEKGELARGVGKDNKEMVMDAIGDMLVCLTHVAYYDDNLIYFKSNLSTMGHSSLSSAEIVFNIDKATRLISRGSSDFNSVIYNLDIIARRYDTSLTECMEYAWNEIKDRKGKFVNGLFVKEKHD